MFPSSHWSQDPFPVYKQQKHGKINTSSLNSINLIESIESRKTTHYLREGYTAAVGLFEEKGKYGLLNHVTIIIITSLNSQFQTRSAVEEIKCETNLPFAGPEFWGLIILGLSRLPPFPTVNCAEG